MFLVLNIVPVAYSFKEVRMNFRAVQASQADACCVRQRQDDVSPRRESKT